MDIAIYITAPLALITGLLIARRIRRNNRRAKLRAQPLADESKQIVRKNVPLYNCLPEPLKDQLNGLVNVFIAEKHFEGCGGLEMTDEIKVTIAAQASMLLLNRRPTYFPKLRTILVYPHTYVAKQNGRDSVRLGESWQNGPVVLTWDSVKGGARNVRDGKNVVLHEFSHQLDQEDGSADGAPILESRSCYATWARVLSAEYDRLRAKKKKFRRSVLNKYGATNPAEFFAVATEAFFEKAKQMKKKNPELYEELKTYYKLDPLEWK